MAQPVLASQPQQVREISNQKSVVAGRLAFIDALRGFDMFFLIGGAEIMRSFNRVWDTPFTAWLSDEFEHTKWQPLHAEDFIFPLFLFIVGLVIPLSVNSMKQKGLSMGRMHLHIAKRWLVLMILGMVSKGLLSFDFGIFASGTSDEITKAVFKVVVGVLQRIGFAYAVCAVLVIHTKWKGQLAVLCSLLLAGWGWMTLIPIAAAQGQPYVVQGASLTIPILSQISIWVMSVPSVLFGVLAAQWLQTRNSYSRKTAGLVIGGFAAACIALLWGRFYPIVFQIWSSSFVVFTAGICAIFTALFYWIVDVRGYKKWATFFIVIGMNAVTIYFLRVTPGLVDFNKASNFVFGGIAHYSGIVGPLVLAIGFMLLMWLLCYFLYKHKIFIKA